MASFTQARTIVRHTFGISRLALLTATASYSRPRLAGVCSVFLKSLARDGRLTIRYQTNGKPRKIFLRLAHLQSDLCSALELAINDCYRLNDLGDQEFIVDGGGNTGLFALAAQARWPHSNITVCEPVPDNLQILQANLSANRVSARILPICLGGEAGTARFYCREANQGSFSQKPAYSAVIDVSVGTLSEICRDNNGKKTLIKLDVEGAEVDVIREFLRVPWRNTTIVGELHDQSRQKPVLCEILKNSHWRARFIREDEHCSQFQFFSPDLPPAR
jgi:FkbM family methyltransferase